MLVMTKAPIVEEMSSANGKKRRKNKGKFGEQLKKGYTKLKDAGGITTIENLLGVGMVDPNIATQTPVDGGGGKVQDMNMPITDPNAEPDKKGMSKTTKIVLWSVGILAVAGISYYLYTKNKGGKVSSSTIKA